MPTHLAFPSPTYNCLVATRAAISSKLSDTMKNLLLLIGVLVFVHQTAAVADVANILINQINNDDRQTQLTNLAHETIGKIRFERFHQQYSMQILEDIDSADYGEVLEILKARFQLPNNVSDELKLAKYANTTGFTEDFVWDKTGEGNYFVYCRFASKRNSAARTLSVAFAFYYLDFKIHSIWDQREEVYYRRFLFWSWRHTRTVHFWNTDRPLGKDEADALGLFFRRRAIDNFKREIEIAGNNYALLEDKSLRVGTMSFASGKGFWRYLIDSFLKWYNDGSDDTSEVVQVVKEQVKGIAFKYYHESAKVRLLTDIDELDYPEVVDMVGSILGLNASTKKLLLSVKPNATIVNNMLWSPGKNHEVYVRIATSKLDNAIALAYSYFELRYELEPQQSNPEKVRNFQKSVKQSSSVKVVDETQLETQDTLNDFQKYFMQKALQAFAREYGREF